MFRRHFRQFLAASACAILICSGVTSMGQLSLDSHGIRTYVPGQAEFERGVTGLTFAGKDDKYFLPFGIVVQNRGNSTIVAYSLQWIFDNGDGQPVVKEYNYTSPAALNDGANPRSGGFDADAVFVPGDSRLLTPVHNRDLRPKTNSLPLTSSPSEAKQEMTEFARAQSEKPFKEVRLASYVLADGTCVTSFESKLCTQLQATVDATQDILQAAQAQEFKGDKVDYINSLTNKSISLRKGSDRGDEDYKSTYDTIQSALLAHIGRQIQGVGYEQMIANVKSRLYQTRPSITEKSN